MKFNTLARQCMLAVPTAACLFSLSSHAVWINEIHYDNSGTDVNEGVELVGQANTSIEGWSLLFYNGGNGAVYDSIALAGSFSDQQAGFGSLFFANNGIQNGIADGIALVDASNMVLEFISYEGTLVATDGAANGLLSVDIGISEATSTPLGSSLQLIGMGSSASDFTWVSQSQSFGNINAGQSLTSDAATVPVPTALPLFSAALLGLYGSIRRKQSRKKQGREK